MEELLEGNEIENTEEVEEEVMEETETSGDGMIGKVVLGLGSIAIAGALAWAYKNRDKIEERRISKLEKKGYIIYRPDECEDKISYDEIYEEKDQKEEK